MPYCVGYWKIKLLCLVRSSYNSPSNTWRTFLLSLRYPGLVDTNSCRWASIYLLSLSHNEPIPEIIRCQEWSYIAIKISKIVSHSKWSYKSVNIFDCIKQVKPSSLYDSSCSWTVVNSVDVHKINQHHFSVHFYWYTCLGPFLTHTDWCAKLYISVRYYNITPLITEFHDY